MESRPPHPVPDIEAILDRIERLDGFEVDYRQVGHLYAVIRYRAGEPVGASMWIANGPRHREACTKRLEDFVDTCLNSHDDELHIPPANKHDRPDPERSEEGS
jgi:hypothetical protein